MSNFHKNSQSTEPNREGHRDYEYNLDWSKKFITKVESGLPKGVGLLITSSHHFPSSLLMISWTPPRRAPIGKYAVPVFMHVPHREFVDKAESVFKHHVRMANEWNSKHPEWEYDSA